MQNIIDMFNVEKYTRGSTDRNENPRKEADKVDGGAAHGAEFSNFSRCVWKLDSEA